ncbi:response regulator [Candidatus Saccharibacteria bacterium QS_5_54_17]|jgi:DNA-binding response OmpR family regulator|nr:MAG: response regulator [Candidatus Saccharibacteria bacterium QS_5_54_17]
MSDSFNSKIAIVEDDIAIVQMYQLKFRAEGYEVAFAEDGEQGLQLIEEFQPDIVLLDLMMPVMNGTEVLKKLRKEDWGKDLKVIVLTNMSESEAPDEMNELGVEEYIVKSDLTPKEVTAKIKQALGN